MRDKVKLLEFLFFYLIIIFIFSPTFGQNLNARFSLQVVLPVPQKHSVRSRKQEVNVWDVFYQIKGWNSLAFQSVIQQACEVSKVSVSWKFFVL